MDKALEYAYRIVDGEIPACPMIEAVCKRFIGERERVPRHLYWDDEDAEYVLEQARLCNVKMGSQRVPFEPLGWQAFLLQNIWGWKIRDQRLDPLRRVTDSRRTRKVFLLSAKGSGKSSVVVPLIFMGMLDDPESEVYVLAPTEEVARRAWKEARAMVAADEKIGSGLYGMFHFTGGTSASNAARMVCRVPGYESSRFYTVGSTHLSGPIVQMAIVDEYQGITDRRNVDELEDGTKQRLQPLIVYLSNAGRVRHGPCWEERERARKMCEGTMDWADDYLPMVYEIPEEQSIRAIAREKVGRTTQYTGAAMAMWEMANPSYPSVIRPDYVIKTLDRAVRKGAGPEDRSEPYRNMFSIWPRHASEGEEYIRWNSWQPSLVEAETLEFAVEPELLAKCRVYLGLDLARTHNLTAMARVWKLEDLPAGHMHWGKLLARVDHYTPGGTLAERARLADEAPFERWARQGFIKTEQGTVSTYDGLSEDLLKIWLESKVAGCAFDNRFFAQFQVAMERQGIPWVMGGPDDCGRESDLVFVDHIQTLVLSKDPNRMDMPKSMKALYDRLDGQGGAHRKGILIEENAFLNWQVNHAIRIEGQHGGKKIGGVTEEVRKGKSHYDGLIALTMAVGLADWVRVDKWSPTQGGGWSDFKSSEWSKMF